MNRLSLIAVSFLVLTVVVGAPSQAEHCRWLELEEKPAWISASSWTPGGGLAVVDAAQRTVTEYGLDGRVVQKIDGLEVELGVPFRPSILRRSGRSLFLEIENGPILRLSAQLAPMEAIHLLGRRTDLGARLASIAGPWVVDGGAIVGFGDFFDGRDGFAGIFRAPFEGGVELVSRVEIGDPMRDFFHVGRPWLARSGDATFLLDPARDWRLTRLDGVSAQHAGAAASLALQAGTWPATLPKLDGLARAEEAFAALSEPGTIAGIYGMDGAVVLLQRGSSRIDPPWQLARASTATDGGVRVFDLPTSSPHVEIVPGDRFWAVIEKGTVRQLGRQPIGRTLLIPTEWLHGDVDDYRMKIASCTSSPTSVVVAAER